MSTETQYSTSAKDGWFTLQHLKDSDGAVVTGHEDLYTHFRLDGSVLMRHLADCYTQKVRAMCSNL